MHLITPVLEPDSVDLLYASEGTFAVEQPYSVSPSEYTMKVGAESISPDPIANGIQPGAGGFFDFDFSGAFNDPNAIEFSYEGSVSLRKGRDSARPFDFSPLQITRQVVTKSVVL